MRINLLGPLQAHGDDHRVDLAPAAQKVRQTLALLALNAGRVVRFEQLMDELWDDDPPASAHTALQTYVYQLRKRFSLGNPRSGGAVRAASPLLGTVDGGYQLSLPAAHVDVFRCEPLLSRARAEFRDEDFARARDTVTAALQLWRDDALVDVRKGPMLQAEAVRLNELRTSAHHLRIEADLQLGRHHEVLGELTSMAGREPTNEWAQRNLMTALYRMDRRAEALGVYRRARERIATELGLDPSPELQALHMAVLSSDDELLRPAGRLTAVTATTRTPCHLPAPRERLTGRDGQLGLITAALAGRARADRPLVIVGGAPGTGKSELCLHAAHQVSGHYPDGRLYARLRDGMGRRVRHAEILRSFLRGLGAREEQLRMAATDLSLLFRTWTADLRVLVVLDDVCAVQDLTPLLPSGPGCGVVIGSRRRLFVSSSAVHVELAGLPFEDCLHVLASSVPSHRTTMDPEGLRRLAGLCRGLPGALFAVAGQLRRRPHWTARQATAWVLASAGADSDPLGVRAGFDRTLAALPAESRSLVHALLSGAPDRLTPALVAATLGIGDQRAEDLLEELAESYLLRPRHPCANGKFSYEWEPGVRPIAARHSDAPVMCSA
ncbi:BTAD domain-containing putative transcriptional regulator [Streptomyces sp. NBC_00568]|uniref:AfsR/SARP family transcriptional regulator n=1 Tax=Streptomyces sp. NBC_00568 TaxID=2975779 RepID=UPI002252EEEB|nr:BTAD domain-containing putative transcriptional regulator [Streptomyces sp. NBC_00568]MCX4993695.1 winged helix-turn-helix domain-containing protein [Streptomyces sp. NBC_00568]